MSKNNQPKTFYCADWNRCGSICEEQCQACEKADNLPELIPDKPESIWFVVDENGYQFAFSCKPFRTEVGWQCDLGNFITHINYPLSIQAITGRTLTWQDEPLEWKPGEVKGTTPCVHDWDSVKGGGYYCKICDKHFYSED